VPTGGARGLRRPLDLSSFEVPCALEMIDQKFFYKRCHASVVIIGSLFRCFFYAVSLTESGN